MDKVIGLGKLGCSVAEELTAYPEYRIYKIDAGIDERGSLRLEPQKSIDNYEQNLDQDEVSVYLRSIKEDDDVLLIVEGGDPVSGATLKILETIKDANLSVLYLCPDREMISEISKRDDKICYNILQEYARSGVLENIFLVNQPSLDQLIGDVSISEYEKSVSYFVAYVLAMINYFTHTEPVLANKIQPSNISRIVTLGTSSIEEEGASINLLFPLAKATDIHFYYGIPKQDLLEDTSLIKKIKQHVKNYKTSDLSTSFSVYETSLEARIVLCVAHSSKIQALPTQ